MARTLISDVIVPEVFAPYISNRTKELSAIVESGIAVSNSLLDDLVTNGGKLINMPFWQDLVGEDKVLSETKPLEPNKIVASQDVAALILRGSAWSTNHLSGALAGSDPMAEIGTKLARWWVRREQQTLLSILKGVFSSPSMSEHINDKSTEVIDGKLILDTKQLLGDASDILSAIAMHSAVYTTLQKQSLIEYEKAPISGINYPTYLGYRVIIDDSSPRDGDVYTTYMFASGSIGRGEGVPTSMTPVEMDRDILQGDSYLVNNRAFVLHPFGVKFANKNVSGVSPSNEELADGTNWERVYEDKQIGLAALKHTI